MKITLAKPIAGPDGLISEVEVGLPADIGALDIAPAGVDLGAYFASLYTKLPIEVVSLLSDDENATLAKEAHRLADAWEAVKMLRANANCAGMAR